MFFRDFSLIFTTYVFNLWCDEQLPFMAKKNSPEPAIFVRGGGVGGRLIGEQENLLNSHLEVDPR